MFPTALPDHRGTFPRVHIWGRQRQLPRTTRLPVRPGPGPERQQGPHPGLPAMADAETLNLCDFLLFSFPLLVLSLSQAAPGKGCDRGKQRKVEFKSLGLPRSGKAFRNRFCVRARFPEPPPHPQTRKGLPGWEGSKNHWGWSL